MKPQARVQAVIEINETIGSGRIPMDAVVGDYMRSRRYIGSKDRANIAERVYAMMRMRARIGWRIEQLKAEDTPRTRMIAFLVIAEESDEKYIAGLFDGSQYAPEVLSDAESTFLSEITKQKTQTADMPEAVRAECPPIYEEKLKAYFGDDFEAELAAMLEPAALDLRANMFLTDRDGLKASLSKDGIETDETPYSPWGLRCRDKAYLAKSKAFKKGWVSIQDEGSQLIAYLCGAQPGMQVLDYCAGAGGKTLALASAMKRKGRIVAMDNDERRLKKGRERYKRAQLADIIEVRALSDDKQRKWLKRQKGKFDVVLCDVPCSGTGTWRRNPDMRWFEYGPSLEELTAVQAEIMDAACRAVKPSGRLVYATCSLLPEENEAQVERFLKEHPEFTVQPPETEALGAPYMRLTPHRHATDGFFAAVLQKSEA